MRSAGARASRYAGSLLVESGDRPPALDRAVAVAAAGWTARYLATVPSNVKNPAWLAERAREAADEAGLTVKVWDEKQLAADGFGGILAVGSASATPPRLIRLDYTPQGRGKARGHVVLVGKGITFDTGGLSIKPGEAMVNMKRDMTGGAVVIATMAALAALEVPVRVTGLVAAAENAIGGDAMRPGDVIRHYGGRTTEVTNTDAEGRLVMADALAYAVDEIGPDALVDIATLTGAMKVALGLRTGGYFANHEGLADADRRGLRVLRRAPVADAAGRRLRGAAAPPRSPTPTTRPAGPGAITAALFLQHFTGDVPVGAPRRGLDRRRAQRLGRVDRGPDRLRLAGAAALARQQRPARRHPMRGLTVRWSLADAPADVGERLATYVAETSHARFSAMEGLGFKTWRMRAGGVVRGLLRLRLRRGARGVPGGVHRDGRRGAGVADHRQRADPHRGVRRRRRSPRARTASPPRRGPDQDRPVRPVDQVSGTQTFLAASRPSPTGSSTGTSVVVAGDGPAELADRRPSPRRAGPGRPPGRATARCRRPPRRRGAAGAAPR